MTANPSESLRRTTSRTCLKTAPGAFIQAPRIVPLGYAKYNIAFLLLAQKKVTKEKGTLAAAVCRHPCRQTSRAGGGVRPQHIRVLRSNSPASCRRSLRD